MATAKTRQKQMASNRARSLIFVEGENLCFNYKTGQWTRIPGYNDSTVGCFFTINSKTADIGLVRSDGVNAASLQTQTSGALTATFVTGEADPNEGGRTYVDAVRPLVNGGTPAVRVGVRDSISDAVTWSTGTALNSRTEQANFRSAANYPEGKYVRIEITIPDDFTTALGADIDYEPTGRV